MSSALHCAAVTLELGGASIAWGLLILLLSLCASLTLVVTVPASLPATYYQDRSVAVRRTQDSRGLWGPFCLVKNALGLILIVAGAVLSLPGIPGRGLLTILVGFMLLDFPRKRPLERKLLGRPGLLSAINRLRERFGETTPDPERRTCIAGEEGRRTG
jgi:hypothetical protein